MRSRCPPASGDAAIRALLRAGETFGILPYGTEALACLRIEKGHPAGGELNGQTTAHDLGLERMMSKRKDFIGRVLAQRPALLAADRPALVGLRPVDRTQPAAGRGAFHSGWHGSNDRPRPGLDELGRVLADAWAIGSGWASSPAGWRGWASRSAPAIRCAGRMSK